MQISKLVLPIGLCILAPVAQAGLISYGICQTGREESSLEHMY